MSGALRVSIVVAAAVAATIVANFVLLGVATGRQDPVGRLSPQTASTVPAAAASVVKPPSSPPRNGESEHRDD